MITATRPTLALRPYQEESSPGAITDAALEGIHRPLVALPTGPRRRRWSRGS